MPMTRIEAAQLANQARHNIPPEEESAIAKRAAHTRLKKNPNAFKEMGALGGRSRAHKQKAVIEEVL